jgi:hypothetical protein
MLSERKEVFGIDQLLGSNSASKYVLTLYTCPQKETFSPLCRHAVLFFKVGCQENL